MLKFTAKYVAKGVMSEPIDDACLEVGECSFYINHVFHVNDIFDAVEIRKNCYELYNCDRHGISIHGSTVRVYLSVEELISKGILVEITDEQYRQIENCKMIEHELALSNYKVNIMCETAHLDYCTQMDIDNYVSSIVENIHAMGVHIRTKFSIG